MAEIIQTITIVDGKVSKEEENENDLGVRCRPNLKVAKKCQVAYKKANRMLGLINRTIVFKSPDILLNLYKALVRPHVEYCSTVWNPFYFKDS